MMELGDMPGMSPIFRISRLGTFSLKRVIVILNSSKCDPKTGLHEICVSDFLCERWPSQVKRYPNGQGLIVHAPQEEKNESVKRRGEF